ncbi:cytoplasmic tRNA 2-thiolation protein 1-like [Lytechinus variegatus]|uniref:cytoplasmic tRNA 2-thiolation protein 1-like n=1 Tax=Lytechinus variegatus TaxID=7654 RepID=UPI001BB29A07|nr:cytoplasmic tRNA 2-thiolation protein 1-like [Lytechinus variegatus]
MKKDEEAQHKGFLRKNENVGQRPLSVNDAKSVRTERLSKQTLAEEIKCPLSNFAEVFFKFLIFGALHAVIACDNISRVNHEHFQFHKASRHPSRINQHIKFRDQCFSLLFFFQGDALCKDCFYAAFESEIHHTITTGKLFTRGERVAVGASGGKDSTVLAYVLKLLNERYDYGLDLVLLSVDEGITGYRDDSLETVKRNQQQYDLPLKIVSYEELYGWTMDAIVKQIGLKNNCTFCGVFRRQALDRGAMLVNADKIVTGHNADDIAETVLMNILRGDIARLRRCTDIITGGEGALPRCKPFKYTYEKEIVMYAYFKKLDYFSTECIYSPNAYRGYARAYLKDLEKIRSTSIIDIIHSGESLSIKKDVKMPTQGTCSRCAYISSQPVCKACTLLEGLNKGLPKLGIGKPHKARQRLDAVDHKASGGSSKPSSSHLPMSSSLSVATSSSSLSSNTAEVKQVVDF